MNWFNILKDEEGMESQRIHPQIERTTMMGMQMPMEMRALREFQTINMEDPCCEYIRDEMEKYFTDMFYRDTNMSRENTVQDMKTLVKYIKELDCKEINELMQPENSDPTLRGIHFPRKRFLDEYEDCNRMVQYWSKDSEAGKDFDSQKGKLTPGELKDWERLREKRRNWEDWLHSKGKRNRPASRKLDDIDTEEWQ